MFMTYFKESLEIPRAGVFFWRKITQDSEDSFCFVLFSMVLATDTVQILSDSGRKRKRQTTGRAKNAKAGRKQRGRGM